MSKNVLIISVLVLLIGISGYFLYSYEQSSGFEVNAKDLIGRSVLIHFGQVWPFDADQHLEVKEIGRRYINSLAAVVVEVKAKAKVNPTLVEKEKKDMPLPASIKLEGLLKLTYEKIGNAWYLISADNLNLKALPEE